MKSREFYAVMMMGVIVWMSAGCTRKVYVPVRSVETGSDTLLRVEARIDSVVEKDSVVVTVKGDTVERDRWHWRERVRLRTDTLYKSRVDTVRQEIPVIVPSAPSHRKSVSCFLYGILLGLLLVLAGRFIKRTRDR